MPLDPLKKVPAVFKNDTEHLLTTDNGPHFEDENKPYSYFVGDASDNSKKPGIIAGKQIMIYPQEAYGMTYWHDPKGNQPSLLVGIGHVAMPQHKDKTKEELIELGYQFHEPRADFKPIYPLEHYQPVLSPVEKQVEQAVKDTSVEQQQAVVIPQTPVQEATEEEVQA